MIKPLSHLTVALALAGLVACDDGVDPLPPLDPSGYDCSSCHGGADSSAPPRGVDGRSDPTLLGVGAHQAHTARGVACSACHVVPTALLDPGHVDTALPAEVALTSSASWDHAAATCANTYCHGIFTPKWTQLDGTQAACGTCHALPPPAPHPASATCEACHAPVAGPQLTILDPTRHVDGRVDLTGQARSCAAGCHGSDDEPIPPPDLSGHTETTALGVGAHLVHQTGGRAGKPVACTACHLSPATVSAPGHVDTSTPAEVMLGRGGTWDHAAATCTTFCHGTRTPLWTLVDGSQVGCAGGCHGFPPPAPHPASASCRGCHTNAGAGMTVDRATHVDGTVQF